MGYCPKCSVNTGVELVRGRSASPDGVCFLRFQIVLKMYEAVQGEGGEGRGGGVEERRG